MKNNIKIKKQEFRRYFINKEQIKKTNQKNEERRI